jgi:hypothetical protein
MPHERVRAAARCGGPSGTLSLMLPRRTQALALALGLMAAVVPAARADVLPPPQRPAWDQHPPPLPEPPPEKDLERVALATLAGLALLGVACARAKQTHAERPS